MTPSKLPAHRLRTKIYAALLLVLAFGGAARAQEPDEPVETINSNLVILNVGVADRKGQAVTDLSRGDFSIYEDGARQSIVSFEPTSAPFSLVLLLDMSGSTLNFRPTLKQSALRFIDALAPGDRVAVISFWTKRDKGKSEGKVVTLTDFTEDRRDIAHAISNAEGAGGTNLYEGLRFALRQLAHEGKRRKAVVVLTDGKDTELETLDRKASGAANTNEEALAAVKPETNRACAPCSTRLTGRA